DCYGRVLETRGVIDFGGGTHDVETVDGLVMALSPWAVRNLRFDEDSYEGFDAYDADFCAQARAAGKRVVVTELPVIHRHTRVGSARDSSDGGSFERNEKVFREKWLGATHTSAAGTLAALPAGARKFDAMIFGDVLEHLLDPVRLLRMLLPALADDGVLVLSIPNVKHWTVLYPLLVKDRWTYEDAGLLDRTHVHLFTGATAAEMLSGLGLEIVHVGVNDLAPLPPEMEPLAGLAAALGGDRTEAVARLGAYQYLLVARPGAATPGAAA